MVQYEEPWDLYSDDVHSVYGEEHTTISDLKVYWWTGDDTNYQRYSSHQDLTCTPGDSYNDEIDRVESKHNWGYYGGSGLDIVENEPEDGSNNNENLSLSIGYNGATITWDYGQGGDVKRTVDQNNADIVYNWDFTDFDNGEDSSNFATGSEIAADTDPGLFEGLFEQYTYANYITGGSYTTQHDFLQRIDMNDG